MAKKISLINFKGGVGKTTIALHLATGIERYHSKRVLVVDVDHQSSLSIVCLKKNWEPTVDKGKTVSKVFSHFTNTSQGLPGREIITTRPFGNRYPNLDIVSANLELDDLELDLASTTSGNAMSSEFRKRTLLCSWIDKNNLDKEYDYILFDCPPATKLVSQNALSASDFYLVPVVPDEISSRGIQHLVNMLKEKINGRISNLADFLLTKGEMAPSSYVRETELKGVIFSKVKVAGNAKSGYTNDHTEHLTRLESQWKDYVIKPYIEEGSGVPESMAKGLPVYDDLDNRNVINRNYHTMFRQLVDKVIGRIG